MKFNKATILLTLILLVALFLRTWDLSKIPVSMTIDEVGFGYNTYSILKTGCDEFGAFLPLVFRSIGDYKPPLLVYLSIPAVAIFGLNEFGTRITVAISGFLTVLVIYFLIRRLTKNQMIALITAFSVAISPWHIRYSHATYEATLGLLVMITGAYFLIRAIQEDGKFLWVSAVFFSLSLYAYNAERLFSPLFILAAVIIYWKKLLSLKKQVIIAAILGLLVLLPLIPTFLIQHGSGSRAQMVFLSRDVEINRFLYKNNQAPEFPFSLLDNNILLFINFWGRRYLDYFDLRFLFVNGMGYALPNSPDVGLLYLVELPFFLLGVYLVVFQKEIFDPRIRKLVIAWFLLGPLAASLANNPQHSLRNLTSIPVLQLFFAIGFFKILSQLKKNRARIVLVGTYLLVSLFGILYFSDLFKIQYQLLYSEYAMDGWKEAALYATQNREKYEEIVIDPRFGIFGPYTVGTPYLYVLFYGRVDPRIYQSDHRRKEFDSSSNFKNFTFREINWISEFDRGRKKTLFIGSPWVLPADNKETLQKFYLRNGREILRAATPV